MMLKSQEITAIRNATVIKPLALGVVDTLESVNEENIDSKSILAGVLMRLKQILLDSGVEKLPCNPGDAYDPRWHVAVDWLKSGDAQSQSKNANSTGIIEQVIRDGYSVDGVLMRKAEVKVFKSS
uniref:GrpE protein homolog n=1 Tax=Amorphochlora amoebiformis TaxID=1561963 RepID=A0A7S0GX11_9EUKA|mmetsp:Transcript_18629/g.29678  ORF Transcript_18629/g.29678 Transcript_18629/m.29678 type:complete len:125 (+) Transcript_18629:3-377(+)